jgi:chaperonin GroEL
MSKTIQHGKDAREALLRGIDFLADAVKITEGPRGRNCILGQRGLGQSPKVTRDGVTVSNYADPSDPTEQLGADLVREAAQRTDNAVGDGTTASIVLAQSMVHTGFDLIAAGANPMAIERGIHKATDAVVARLLQMAIEVDEVGRKVTQIATVSAHGDSSIGALVADAIQKAGKDGVVTAEPSTTSKTYVDSVAGLELPKSNLIHQAFITHPEEMKAELLNCRILLWEGVIATAKSIVPLLKQVNESQATGGTPLLIIAGGYEAEALACIIKNKVSLALPLIAVRLEAYGERRKEVLQDIAALTGGKAYTEDMGMKIENVKLADLGTARKVVTTMSKTQIVEGRGHQDELTGRIQHIKSCMESLSPAEQGPFRQRLAALLGGITIIKVGGVTVTEMEEKKDRVVDAMSAAKAAVESGIVAGGGTALFNASAVLAPGLGLNPAEMEGLVVVHQACKAVVKQIAENAGIDGDLMIDQLMAVPDLGYNALTDTFEHLVESGIIDPVAVVIEALKNASAVACSILTMGATISEIRQEKANG